MSVAATPPSDAASARSGKRIAGLLSWLLLAMSLAWLAAAVFYVRLPAWPLLYLGPRGLALGGLAIGAVGLAARRAPPALGLALVATIYAGTLAYNVLGPKHGWLAPFARHDRYGHIGIANAGGFHWSHPEFLVEYHFDDHGWRRSPEPREPVRGTIVFLGCSYTFGIGVEDDEVYVARLAERWPHYRVLNHSFPGWASTESLVVLEDDLKAHPTPKAVLYGWIDDHQRRNWLRRSWHKNKLAWGGLIQFYELEDGRLVHRGLIDPARATAEDTPETTAIEEQLSLALLKRMHDICNERGTAFYFVAFNQWYSGKSRVPQMVREAGIPTIDATALSTDFFPNDTHPTPAWHRAVAERIAGDPRLKAFRE